MKRPYRTVLVVDGQLSEDQIEATVKRTESLIQENAELTNKDRRGKQRLAYQIRKKTHGDYTVFAYESEGAFVAELEKKLQLDENILRSLTVIWEPLETAEPEKESSKTN